MAGPNRSPLIFLESADSQSSKNVVSLSAGPPMTAGFSPAYPEQVLQAAPYSGMPRATVLTVGLLSWCDAVEREILGLLGGIVFFAGDHIASDPSG